MKISNRLKAIASLVLDDSYIIDVGCDHALLDIYLLQNKKGIRAIASDINEGPLIGAKENIAKCNLSNKIKLLLSNGIENIPTEVNTIVISGMGTSNIISIIFKDKSKLNNVDRIIISSNNDYYLLRKIFVLNDYYIDREMLILENNKYYPIILFKKGNRKYSNFELKYGPLLIKNKDEVIKKYLLNEINKLENINKVLSYKYIIRKLNLINDIYKIKKLVIDN